MAAYFYEFLYRGRPEGSVEAPAWHVVLGASGNDTFGRPYHDEATLSVAQAEAAGWALPTVLAAINTDALKEVERLRLENAELHELFSALVETPVPVV